MATTAKAIAIHRELLDKVSKRVAATLPVRVDSTDANGNPVTTLSQDATPVAGEKIIVIRTQTISWDLGTDSLGLAANKFTPHVIQVCTETNFQGTTDNVNDILTPAELLPVFFEASRTGTVVEWYRSANATAPATAQMTAANLGYAAYPMPFNIQSAV